MLGIMGAWAAAKVGHTAGRVEYVWEEVMGRAGAGSSLSALSSLSMAMEEEDWGATGEGAGEDWEDERDEGSGGCDREVMVKGLVNLGNTCYLNAVLQTLAVLPGFPELLGNVVAMPGSSPSSRLTHVLLKALSATLEAMCGQPGDTHVAPSTLHRALPPPFSGTAQQDAGELVHVLLNALLASGTCAGDTFRSLFVGQISFQTTCSLCGYASPSAQTEEVSVIHLPVSGCWTSALMVRLQTRFWKVKTRMPAPSARIMCPLLGLLCWSTLQTTSFSHSTGLPSRGTRL